ncbi:MAG: hypothetical protein HND52_04810 [Ignavibacteriae bacterium]|nr:hypothetical protein [Ignavibacteriota bacterium]NOG97280.1 hypothetical protein [Ignavibacteriota bacterium]
MNITTIRILLPAGLILLVPLVAMQFTNEVNWSFADFIAAGVLLISIGLAYEFVIRKNSSTTYKIAFGVGLAAALLLIWSNLAVGIIGSEDNPLNLMYFGVIVIVVIGAAAARLKPKGMSRAMLMAAFAQTLSAIIAIVVEFENTTISSIEIILVNAFFIALWVGSAFLFSKAK